jgi:hypothetical protein
LFTDVESLLWTGPTGAFKAWTEAIEAPKLFERALEVEGRLQQRA